jgi:hypothetical protein
VDAGVGSAGGVGGHPVSEEALEHALELGLDRSAGGLALPSDERGAVELQRGEKCPAHRAGI